MAVCNLNRKSCGGSHSNLSSSGSPCHTKGRPFLGGNWDVVFSSELIGHAEMAPKSLYSGLSWQDQDVRQDSLGTASGQPHLFFFNQGGSSLIHFLQLRRFLRSLYGSTNTGGSPKCFTLPHALWSCHMTKHQRMAPPQDNLRTASGTPSGGCPTLSWYLRGPLTRFYEGL